MKYQLAYQDKDGNWNVDRSVLRTYKTLKAAKAAIEFMVVKTGVKIVRAMEAPMAPKTTRHREGVYCCDCTCPECESHRKAIALGGNAATRFSERVPNISKEVGNVLDHWEQLPNDFRSDPTFAALDAALQKLYKAVME